MTKITAFVFSFIMLTGTAFGGQNSFTTSYPAPQASYTKIMLVNQSNAANICGAIDVNNNHINNGALFVDPASGSLETCVNGTLVASMQGCFNRFCADAPSASNVTAPSPNCSSTLPLNCPAGYAPAKSGDVQIADTFLTGSTSGAAPYYWTTSIVCCQTTSGSTTFYSPS